jgi:hypothetical protein
VHSCGTPFSKYALPFSQTPPFEARSELSELNELNLVELFGLPQQMFCCAV